MELSELLPILRCPASGTSLTRTAGGLRSTGEPQVEYSTAGGIPDLRKPPARMQIDLPWYEPWDEIDSLPLSFPTPVDAPNLPYHLDRYLAGIAGNEGAGRWILEIGCGERQCEQWFVDRGFRYVGTDVDVRGKGPHLLADAHNLPFKDQSFDAYCSMAVYEHLVSPLTAALEGFRVLRPGGQFFGSAAFVYGFHDRASFHHMTHAGLYSVLRLAGFEVERLWPDWHYTDSIPQMAFRGGPGAPWRVAGRMGLKLLEHSFLLTARVARKLAGKRRLDIMERTTHFAGSVSFAARRPL